MPRPHHAFVRLGGHPAIDFLNTAYAPQGVPIEEIGNGQAFLDWLVEFGLLERAPARDLARRAGRAAIDAAATDARRVREWAREWLGRWRADPRADQSRELTKLNRLLSHLAPRREVRATDDGLALVERPLVSSADVLLGLVAASIADLVTKEDPARVDACAGTGCTIWFLDRTKARRRRFCSAAACGNRAKVAAFRERKRVR